MKSEPPPIPTAQDPGYTIVLRNRDVPGEAMIADLQRVFHDGQGRLLTHAAYSRVGKYGARTIALRFGSWNEALRIAGLPHSVDRDLSDQQLFDHLALMWRRLGRQPQARDMTKRDGQSRISESAYRNRFGSWHKALAAFADYLRQAGTPDVVVLQREQAEVRIARGRPPRSRFINTTLRAAVLIRDNCICRLCGASPAKDPAVTLHVDHIRPWSKGGETVLANLQTLCAPCNRGKADSG